MDKLKKFGIPILFGLFFILSFVVNWRKDFTADKLYTLSNSTGELLDSINKPLTIKILLSGNIPGDFRTLRNEIEFLLEEFQKKNPLIKYEFVNPTKEFTTEKLVELGLSPIPIKVDHGNVNIYPYAEISDGERAQWFPVIFNEPRLNLKELPLFSIQKLEYIFLNEIQRFTKTKREKVGLLVHHDELPENQSMGLFQALGPDYDVIPYLKPLADSTKLLSANSLAELQEFDVLISAKPTVDFKESDKLILDQYIMTGGKMLWMLETVDAEMDSIFRSGRILAFPRQLNLEDFLFNYGVRLLPMLVKDSQGTSITLADGETAGKTSYNYYPFPYFARGLPAEQHPINQSLGGVKFEFANPIELLEKDSIKQTVLLATAGNSSLTPSLQYLELGEVNMNKEEFVLPPIPLAVLLEGKFRSAYAGRIERTDVPNFKAETEEGKMIVISDGDVAKNHLLRGNPMPLGADKYSLRPDNPNQKPLVYANENFIKNCVDYLLGKTELLQLRNKQIEIPLFDNNKVESAKSNWQWINLVLPMGLVVFIGLIGLGWRNRVYR